MTKVKSLSGRLVGAVMAFAISVPALLLVAPQPVGVAASSARAERPNFVIIFLDDMRKDEMVAMPFTRRRIQAEGATFANAYSTYPLCCPARASILTGQYAHNHGVLSNHAPVGGVTRLKARHTIARWLDSEGYRTGYVGKYLNGYGHLTPKRYVPRGWDTWNVLAKGQMNYRHFKLNLNGRLKSFDRYQTGVLGRRAADFVSHKPRRRPFLLITSFLAPHTGDPREPDDPEGIRTPAVTRKYRNTESDREMPVTDSYNEDDVSDKPEFIQDNEQMTEEQQAAYRELGAQRRESIRTADDEIRRIVRALVKANEMDNTYFVVTSDNGFLLGEHRIRFGKIKAYEPSARVPMVMRGPGIKAGAQVEQLVGLHDLAPTVLRATGSYGARTVALDGRNLLPLIRSDRIARGRDLVMEAGPGRRLDAPYRYRGIRTNTGWKYIAHKGGAVEMYNLNVDPYEMDNLAGVPEYAVREAKLRLAMRQLQDCRGAECR